MFRNCDVDFAADSVLLGVVVVLPTALALTALLPGRVLDPARLSPRLRGVVGARGVPSLVLGRLWSPVQKAGRAGGGILLSTLKKLDFLTELPIGEDGSCCKLSIVRSDSDMRDFLGVLMGASAIMVSSPSSGLPTSSS